MDTVMQHSNTWLINLVSMEMRGATCDAADSFHFTTGGSLQVRLLEYQFTRKSCDDVMAAKRHW